MAKAVRAAAWVWIGLAWPALTGCGTPVVQGGDATATDSGSILDARGGVADTGDESDSSLPQDASAVALDGARRRGVDGAARADGTGSPAGADGAGLAGGPADAEQRDPADSSAAADGAGTVDPADSAVGGGSAGDAADAVAEGQSGALTDAVVDATGGTTGPDATGTDAAGSDTDTGDAAAADTKTDTAAPATEAGPCKKAGAESCGKSLGADAGSLYLCKNGKWKLHKTCTKACEAMPDGVPDRCTEDLAVPAALVQTLDVKPYVEQSCAPHTHPDWPYAAKKCTYSSGGKTATVVTATPSAAKVAAWIVDSAAYIPALWSLRYLDPPSYHSGLQKLATAVLGQSSRIFPIEGGVLENMTGTAWVNHPFYHGVTDGCTWGCYCRINSLHRSEWCAYQAFLGKQTESQCLAKVGSSGLTKAWGNQCLGNHIEAWKESYNHHFRAKARVVHKDVAAQCATAVACSPAKVLNLMHESLFK